ncbi:putative salt-induced outer membrane protein [Ectothiorhodosinus mongolicus]|uniref:Putative salt-induced outer membrane protein n=2 Tax=Ectothiorhodosinus mongolicus TaxID=233100 RepID=A0A1R3VPJ7_9GAMM|nr:DUF481 domain-containing protein [Ectothiorhodosinus mongolicus]SIT66588.1 putative salt-induced outer membrane protein [Ectothiorhodosinus mongolicus]
MSRSQQCKVYLMGLLLLIPMSVMAEWEDAMGWRGSVEFGAALSTGNTDSSNLNAKGRVQFQNEQWRNRASLDVVQSSEDKSTTQERYLLQLQADRRLSANDYLFSAFRNDKDRFSGYDYQRSLSAGYGRRLINTDRTSLEVEAGPGVRQNKKPNESSQNEAVVRGAAQFRHQISDSARFGEELVIISGSDNTEIDSTTSLRLAITDVLAARFAVNIKYNSRVSEGRSKTDTVTTMNLVYDFW